MTSNVPFSPGERLFVSSSGFWWVIFLRGASTGGFFITVSQTVCPGPATFFANFSNLQGFNKRLFTYLVKFILVSRVIRKDPL